MDLLEIVYDIRELDNLQPTVEYNSICRVVEKSILSYDTGGV